VGPDHCSSLFSILQRYWHISIKNEISYFEDWFIANFLLISDSHTFCHQEVVLENQLPKWKKKETPEVTTSYHNYMVKVKQLTLKMTLTLCTAYQARAWCKTFVKLNNVTPSYHGFTLKIRMLYMDIIWPASCEKGPSNIWEKCRPRTAATSPTPRLLRVCTFETRHINGTYISCYVNNWITYNCFQYRVGADLGLYYL